MTAKPESRRAAATAVEARVGGHAFRVRCDETRRAALLAAAAKLDAAVAEVKKSSRVVDSERAALMAGLEVMVAESESRAAIDLDSGRLLATIRAAIVRADEALARSGG